MFKIVCNNYIKGARKSFKNSAIVYQALYSYSKKQLIVSDVIKNTKIDDDFFNELEWIQSNMPQTMQAIESLPDLHNVRLACSMHIEYKMISPVLGFLKKGAQVFLTTCNVDTVRNDVIKYLSDNGADSWTWLGMSQSDHQQGLQKVLDWQPTHLCEMGADITTHLFKTQHPSLKSIKAGLEATGSGINKLSQKLKYPIFDWDDIQIKEGIHNQHMVGITLCHAFMQRTRLSFHCKKVLVIGYGLVGKGVCKAIQAFGGHPLVFDLNPAQQLQAVFDGIPISTIEQALSQVDAIVTCTGANNVLNRDHFKHLKDRCFLMNVGHTAYEIEVDYLYSNYKHKTVKPYIEKVELTNNKQIFVFANGSMANLVAGFGDSLNSFDVCLAAMVRGVGFIVEKGHKYSPGLHMLPQESWIAIAENMTKTYLQNSPSK